MKVKVVENVLKLNDQIAALNRAALRQFGIFTVDLIGAPGCGKTAFLESTLRALAEPTNGEEPLRPAVIVGDLATQRDADRLAVHCPQVIQINTGKGCHLEAHHVRQAMDQMDLSSVDILFIENVGNLICPVGFDLGQDVKVGMFGVCGGDDKAAKHPYLVHEANLLILAKTDLFPHVPFDRSLFEADVRRLNPDTQLLYLSAFTGEGMPAWMNWVRQEYLRHRPVAAMSGGK